MSSVGTPLGVVFHLPEQLLQGVASPPKAEKQGYGLGYTVEEDTLRICVSNYIGDPDTGGSGFGGVSLEAVADDDEVKTDASMMAEAIETALLDIQKIATADRAASKL